MKLGIVTLPFEGRPCVSGFPFSILTIAHEAPRCKGLTPDIFIFQIPARIPERRRFAAPECVGGTP